MDWMNGLKKEKQDLYKYCLKEIHFSEFTHFMETNAN